MSELLTHLAQILGMFGLLFLIGLAIWACAAVVKEIHRTVTRP